MHEGRGIDVRETGTPKEVDDPSGIIPAVNMDGDLHTMRESKPLEPISVLPKIRLGA